MKTCSLALYGAFTEVAFGGIQHARPAQLPELTAALADSGFDDTVIRGFLGENFHRVASAAWQGSPA
jgi:microsomal dipeptidase-like Zn-dependent dipeptidase